MDGYEFIKILIENENGVKISRFKDIFSPIDFADKLKLYLEEGLIYVDWKKGVIYPKDSNSFATFYKKKTKLTKKKSSSPEYMNIEKVEINKPFISKRGD